MLSTLTLENAYAKASFKSKGAELCSFIHKENYKEYIWPADPKIWSRHAPVLFPIVGKLNNDTYEYNGQHYHLPQHGFARDMEFEVESSTSDELKFSLGYSEETLSRYPFKFRFVIGYRLKATTLTISYEVYNEDEQEPLYFSVGAHPAFRCPLSEKEELEDYYLEFNEKEVLQRYLLDKGAFNGDKEMVMDETNTLPLSYSLFEKDAIVFKQFKSNEIILKSNKSPHGVKMSFPGFPYLGIWTKGEGATFICLEPWYGLADAKSASGKLIEKEGIMNLNANEEFDCQYQIEIF